MIKTIFLGTPDFSIPSLEMLFQHPEVDLIKVITKTNAKQGRGQAEKPPPVAEFTKFHKIPLLQTENINKDIEIIRELKPDLIIVLAFSHFLSQDILNIAPMGAFNIHTSILPKYRGAAPIQHALLNGDTKTGVSIQRMVKKMDAGDVCLAHEVNIHPYENLPMLYTRLKYLAALSLNEFIDNLKNNKLKFTPQDESKVSFAPKIKKTDGKINPKEIFLDTLHKKCKALSPWPSTYFNLNEKILKILNFKISSKKIDPGVIDISQGTFLLGLKDETVRITSLQLQGKRKMLDTELVNGLKGELRSS